MSVRGAVGQFGEDLAARHLAGLGYTIRVRNWRCARGEIDLIAQDQGCLVVVEVKTRRSSTFGDPLEAITPAKLARLRRLAGLYLAQLPEHVAAIRIDAVSVVIPARGAPIVEHLQGVA